MSDHLPLDRDFDRILFRSPNLIVGSFRADPQHPRFEDSGPTAHHLFVFPRTAVAIQHDGADRFVAGPPLVTFYNRGQRYRRSRVSGAGDRCEWFAPSAALLTGVVPDRPDIGGGEPPFAYSHGPSDADVYLWQRRFVERCLSASPPDDLAAEEVAIILARRVVASANEAWGGTSGPRPKATRPKATRPADRELVEHAKAILLRRFREQLALATLARAVGCTPFHLCRVFRAVTGWSVHHFRDQVRLRVALEEVQARRGDLIDIALGLGYSSHSHFTASFTRAFGVPPSAWQRLSRQAGDALLPQG